MIGKDIEIIKHEIRNENIETIIDRSHVYANHALYINDKLLESKDENIQLKAVTNMFDSIERYMKFLDDYSKVREFIKFRFKNIDSI